MAASRLSKGKIEEVVKKFRWFPLARPEKYGGSYLKNAWAEIPEVRINVSSDIWVLMQGKFMFFKYSKCPEHGIQSYFENSKMNFNLMK